MTILSNEMEFLIILKVPLGLFSTELQLHHSHQGFYLVVAHIGYSSAS